MPELASGIRTRAAIQRDLPRILDIDGKSFPWAQCWGEQDFLVRLRRRAIRCMVAETADLVVGFTVLSLRPNRVRLLKIAVHPCWRRAGVATELLDWVKAALLSSQRKELAVYPPEVNMPALWFFRAAGFRADRVIPDAFPPHDAIRMRYTGHAH